MGKGTTSQQQSNQNISYNPTGLGDLQQIYAQAANAAGTPYQAYSQGDEQTQYGKLIAGLNSTQRAGISNIAGAQGMAQPYIQAGENLTAANSGPISASQIQSYMNPYQSQVIDATMANINNTNAQQQQQVVGNSALQGALGGDRSAVAQSVLAGQQSLASNQTLAGLNAQNYGQATQTALAEQQAGLAGGQQLANMGISGENTAIAGGQAELGAGTAQQQTRQAQLTSQYQQFLQGLAFPYQQSQFLGNIGTSAAGAMGGYQTQIGQTGQVITPPGLNWTQGLTGLGALGIGAFGQQQQIATGGRINPYAVGGTVRDEQTGEPLQHFDGGGPAYPFSAAATDYMGGTPGTPGTPATPSPNYGNVGSGTTINMPPQTNAASTLGGLGGLATLGSKIPAAYNNISNWFTGNSGEPSLGYANYDNGVMTGIQGVGPTQAGVDATNGVDGLSGAGAWGGTPSLSAAESASAPAIAATDATGVAADAAAAADAASDVAVGAGVADALPLLLAKRGGAIRGYDTGGSPYPSSDAFGYQSGPYALANRKGYVPSSQRESSPNVNYGQVMPQHPLMAMPSVGSMGHGQVAANPDLNPYSMLQQAGSAMKSMGNARGGVIGYADGGSPDMDVEGMLAQRASAADPMAQMDQAQTLQRTKAAYAPVQQTMQPSFAARGGRQGYDDGGEIDGGNLWPDASMPLMDDGSVAVQTSHPSQPAQSQGPAFPPSMSQGPYPSVAAPPAPPTPATPTVQPPPQRVPARRPVSPDAADPGLSWAQIEQPSDFESSTPQRQSIRDMAKKPDFWYRAGLGILGSPPGQGFGAALARGFEGAIGTYDQFSKDDLSAEQKAQELATKIKEHVDQYTKIPLATQEQHQIEREKLAQSKYQAINYIDDDGKARVANFNPKNGSYTDPNTGKSVNVGRVIGKGTDPEYNAARTANTRLSAAQKQETLTAPIPVASPAEAHSLPTGTKYKTPDGEVYTR